jgi:hypothetical protein
MADHRVKTGFLHLLRAALLADPCCVSTPYCVAAAEDSYGGYMPNPGSKGGPPTAFQFDIERPGLRTEQLETETSERGTCLY